MVKTMTDSSFEVVLVFLSMTDSSLVMVRGQVERSEDRWEAVMVGCALGWRDKRLADGDTMFDFGLGGIYSSP